MKTKSITVRVPVQMANEIKSYCETRNMTQSDFVRSKFENVGQVTVYEEGGKIDTSTSQMLISVAGGSLAGVLVYKAVKGKLEAHESGVYTDEKIEVLSVVSGVASALLVGFGLTKLITMFAELKK